MQEDIVKEFELFCTFKVGDSVELGPFNRRSIVGRKWDFGRGEPSLRAVIPGMTRVAVSPPLR